jgi:hypothetical protein
MGQALGEDRQSQQDERNVSRPKYGVEDHGFTLLGVIPAPHRRRSTHPAALPLHGQRVFGERIFNAPTLKALFRETEE